MRVFTIKHYFYEIHLADSQRFENAYYALNSLRLVFGYLALTPMYVVLVAELSGMADRLRSSQAALAAGAKAAASFLSDYV